MKITSTLVVCSAVLLMAASTGVDAAGEPAAQPVRAAQAVAARADLPNIVLILADDLGWGDVGFNGRKDWKTPNLDRLASQGTVFNRWYAGAVVCAPSRGVLLTGKYTIHNGLVRNGDDLPAGEVTIAEALKARGYVTALFGKWHHGQPRAGQASWVHPMDQGFDEFFGFTDAKHAWEKFPKKLWDGREMKPVDGYAAAMFTEHSLDFLQRQKGRPFFLYVPYTETHFNIEAPEEDVAEYRGKFKEKDPAKPVNATYAAMASRLDKEIGKLLAKLDELGLADNTLVIFTSDQGATFEKGNQGTAAFHDSNCPLRGQKRTLWEGGTRVPAVVRWPGKVPAGRTSQDVVAMMDLLPTLLAAAGGQLDPAWSIDGADVLDVWKGKAPAPERTIFWEWRSEGTTQIAAMRGDYKLISPYEKHFELYNVATDPGERRELNAEYPKIAQQLQKELEAWLATERPKGK